MSSVFDSANELMAEMEDCIAGILTIKSDIACLFKQGTGLQCSDKELSEKAVSKADLAGQSKPLFEKIESESLELIALNNKLLSVANGALMLKCGGGGG